MQQCFDSTGSIRRRRHERKACLMQPRQLTAVTTTLEIAYEESGPASGSPVVLLHGFPYDVRQYDAVRDGLVKSERRVLVPYLRGFGPTQYRDQHTIVPVSRLPLARM